MFLFATSKGPEDGATYLKALYIGRYQQTKEQGAKRSAHKMARPRPTPLPEGSTQNMAREEMRLKRSVPVPTGEKKKKKRSTFKTQNNKQHLRLL